MFLNCYKFFNFNALLLFLLSFFVNILFLYCCYNSVPQYYDLSRHRFLALNVYYENILFDFKPEYCFDKSAKNVDRERVENTRKAAVQDTVGYGFLLGILWRLTHSLDFLDMQLVHIFVFSFLMFFFYQCAIIFFNNSFLALLCGILQILYFPLIFLNIHPIPDIWAYYGTIIFLHSLLLFFLKEARWWILFIGGCFFALCQFIRPSLFLGVITFSIFLVVCAFFYKPKRKKSLLALFFLIITNIIFFWLPFITYNKNAYNRYFVGPVGQDLLEGLGEFPNKWGYKLDDGWVGDYIGAKYNVVYGTPEFDDKAKEEFLQAFHEKPLVYFKNILKRIPSLLLPALPWIFHQESPYKDCSNWQEKLKFVFSSWKLFFDFLFRHVYIRLYLLFGYIGMFLALRRKQYFTVFLLLSVLFAGYGKLPSHIEYRYLVPFYWPFSLFIGYFICYIKIFYTCSSSSKTAE